MGASEVKPNQIMTIDKADFRSERRGSMCVFPAKALAMAGGSRRG